jgi:2-keto-4-pentenoate hydratase/2-oxohepta-3-ene-1,7-dioic acid hydratase in catechol pathway
MKLLTFSIKGHSLTRLGAYDGSNLIDLIEAHRVLYDSEAPRSWFSSVSDTLRGGENAIQLATKIISDSKNAKSSDREKFVRKSESFVYRPVVTGCPKILCVAVNYAAHGAQSSTKPPEEPYVFIKFPNSLIGHNSPILLSKSSNKCDSEIELAVIIGKKGKYITHERAMDHVAGYTIFNDFSFRDRRTNKSDPNRINWLHLKNLDTAGPIGPWMVTKDEIPDPNNLKMTFQLNGSEQEKETGTTHDMVHKIPELIEYISNGLTLEPGDVISTGTPFSIALGRERFLNDGDIVSAEIEKIGTLINPVVREKWTSL